MTHFNGIIQVLNLETDKAFLPMAAFARRVSRRAVPRSGGYHLVVLDLAAGHLQPMTEAAARGVNEATSDSLCFSFRLDEGRLVDMCDEVRNVLSHSPKDANGTMQPRELPKPGI